MCKQKQTTQQKQQQEQQSLTLTTTRLTAGSNNNDSEWTRTKVAASTVAKVASSSLKISDQISYMAKTKGNPN